MDTHQDVSEPEPQHNNPETPVFSSMNMVENEQRSSTTMRVNPRPYDGTTSWRGHISHFQRVGRINGWTDGQKLDFLWVSLTGDALTYVENLAPERAASYYELCEALEERFGDSRLAEVFKSELRSRRRKEGESLPALAQDVSRLVQRAYPEIGRQGMEELAIEKFREALPDHEQRMAVFRSKAKTIDQAVATAIDTESWQISERRRIPSQKVRAAVSQDTRQEYCDGESDPMRAMGSHQADQQESLLKKLEELITKFNTVDSAPPEQAIKRPPPRCYYCDKVGHIAKDCRKKIADAKQRTQEGNEQQQH